MKISKSKAIAFLIALGFTKAADWEDAKIIDRLSQAPVKVREDDVPEEFKELYEALTNSANDDKIILTGAEDGKSKKSKSKSKPEKAEKPAKTETKVERDEFGSKVGTISAKVNAVLNDEWQDEAAIVEAAGVTLDQARGRLYYAQQEGVLECRRLVQYRVVKKAKK